MILLKQRSNHSVIRLILLFLVLVTAVGFIGQEGTRIAQLASVSKASSFIDNVANGQVPLIQTLNAKNLKGINSNVAASAALSVRGREVLFNTNEYAKLPIASLTKLMTALVVLERYDLAHKVKISKAAMAQEGEQGVLKLGEILSVKDLLYITLIESSNRAAYALSEMMGQEAFVKMMNAKAAQLGMADTNFKDSTGLNVGSYSTAKDIATLSGYLFEHYPLFREIIGLKEFNLYSNGKLHHKLVNTNKLLGSDGIIGGKTGWTNEAKGCMMAIQKDSKENQYIIHVILGAEDRFEEMRKIIQI